MPIETENVFLPDKKTPFLMERLDWCLSSNAESGLLSYKYDDRRKGYRLLVVKDSPVHIWAASGAPFFDSGVFGARWRAFRQGRWWR